MLTIAHGRALAKKMMESLKTARGQFSVMPGLGIVCFDGDEQGRRYVSLTEKAAKELDIHVRTLRLENNARTEDAVRAIGELSADSAIDGIIVVLPLPVEIDRATVLAAIPIEKDVDVLSANARARFAHEEFPVLPPVVSAAQYILEAHGVAVLGREVLVLGHGILAGAPLAQFMRQCGAKVTVLDQPVRNLSDLTKESQIIICGTGAPYMLLPEHVSEEVVVIDAGMSLEGGKLKGDAHPDVALHASLFTPTPGGVGPLIVSSLMKNVLLLSRTRKQ